MNVTTPRATAVAILDGTASLDKTALGGKAWGVNKMARLGLPVPPAFALTADRCEAVNRTGTLPEDLRQGIRAGIAHLEEVTGRRFGGTTGAPPLLVSVRSGAAISMPGMMDTVLNLGLTSATSAHLAAACGDQEWVQDLCERFRDGYLSIVDPNCATPPDDPWQQLEAAVLAVYASWESARALAYRQHHNIGDEGGTAVTIQAMVFGNADQTSGTGVLFSRNPMTGSPEPYGEWLTCAQGEDVVSGSVTPQPLDALASLLPDVHTTLLSFADRLEQSAREVQDIEFTVESGRLWILQTRTAKRAPQAAVRLAVGLVEDGLISPAEALAQLTPDVVVKSGLCSVGTVSGKVGEPIAKGEPASPGRAVGLAVGDPDEAQQLADEDVDVVLVRPTTSPADVHGMFASVAVVTDLGGSTSHAALVSRELGLPCVVGCGEGTAQKLLGRRVLVDGALGTVCIAADEAEELVSKGEVDPAILTLAGWAREALAVADTDPRDLVGLLNTIHNPGTEKR